jgi:hypothetical protein
MSCDICHTGNRNKPYHSISNKHHKTLIKLFKLFNKKKEGRSISEWDEIYDDCLNEIKQKK